jgi:hypothetical protein
MPHAFPFVLPPKAWALARTLLSEGNVTSGRGGWALQATDTHLGVLRASERHAYLFAPAASPPFELTLESAGLRCSVAAWHLDQQLNATLLWSLELAERPTERHFAPRLTGAALGVICLQLAGHRGGSLRYRLRVALRAGATPLPPWP